jgi:alkylresorcinol/alkylpyrone synthase
VAADVLSIATAAPSHRLSGEMAAGLLRKLAARWDRRPEPLVRILRNTGIEWRHTVYEGDDIIGDHTLGERNALYAGACLELGERVVRQALVDAQLRPQEIDAFISVSCTGFMLPSIDAYLINRFEMKPETRRLPITELGCAAGAVGLTRAWEQRQVYPRGNVLLLSIELPSLTFQPNDRRLTQLVSSMLFADGAAAAVIGERNTAADPAPTGPSLLGSRSYTVPGTLEEMGYNLDQDGFHIVLSPRIPELIKNTIRPQVLALLEEHGTSLAEVRWCAMHPAGPKVLDLVAEELGLTPQQLAPSWKVLKDYGNMSSATVLFVLGEMIRDAPACHGDLGLIIAFGPGLSGEIVLARWQGVS